MDIAKSEGNYTVDQMQKMATIASTADGLNIEGNNFKVCALTGSPDMLLFACERINQLRSALKDLTHEYERDFDASVATRPKWLGDALAI